MVPFAVVKLILAGSFIFIFREKSLFSYLKSRLAAIDPQDLAASQIEHFAFKQEEEDLRPDQLHAVAQGDRSGTSHQYLLHSFYLVCFIEMLENMAGVVGILISVTKFDMFETALSFLVALVNIIITVPLFYDLVRILMQGVPIAYQRTL